MFVFGNPESPYYLQRGGSTISPADHFYSGDSAHIFALGNSVSLAEVTIAISEMMPDKALQLIIQSYNPPKTEQITIQSGQTRPIPGETTIYVRVSEVFKF